MADNEKRQASLGIQDDKTYYELSKPFEDSGQADNALRSFFDELYELRVKHGLADVSVVVKDAIEGSGSFMANFHCGSEIEQEAMAAWLFGRVQGDRQDLVRRANEAGRVAAK